MTTATQPLLLWLSQAERIPGFYFHIAIAHDQTSASSHLDSKLASLWHKYILHLIALLILKPSLAVSLHLQKPSVAPCFSQNSLNLKRKGLCNLTSKATRLINLLSLNPLSYLFAFMSLSSSGISFACLFVWQALLSLNICSGNELSSEYVSGTAPKWRLPLTSWASSSPPHLNFRRNLELVPVKFFWWWQVIYYYGKFTCLVLFMLKFLYLQPHWKNFKGKTCLKPLSPNSGLPEPTNNKIPLGALLAK